MEDAIDEFGSREALAQAVMVEANKALGVSACE